MYIIRIRNIFINNSIEGEKGIYVEEEEEEILCKCLYGEYLETI